MASTGKLEPILAFIAIPFYITGLIGNILVIRIVHKTREMHTTTNFLLVNLAASDVATILFGPLYFTVLLEGYLSNGIGKYVYKLSVLFEICAMASVLSLTVIAVERYRALLKPFRTGLRLKTKTISSKQSRSFGSQALFWARQLSYFVNGANHFLHVLDRGHYT